MPIREWLHGFSPSFSSSFLSTCVRARKLSLHARGLSASTSLPLLLPLYPFYRDPHKAEAGSVDFWVEESDVRGENIVELRGLV